MQPPSKQSTLSVLGFYRARAIIRVVLGLTKEVVFQWRGLSKEGLCLATRDYIYTLCTHKHTPGEVYISKLIRKGAPEIFLYVNIHLTPTPLPNLFTEVAPIMCTSCFHGNWRCLKTFCAFHLMMQQSPQKCTQCCNFISSSPWLTPSPHKSLKDLLA